MSKAQMRNAGKTQGPNSQGIVLDEQSQEQPTDKDRAGKAAITAQKEDELQPLKEKSGF